MLMTRPWHGCRSEHITADNPILNHAWVANRTHEAEGRLRRKSQVYRCIRFIECGLRQVHWPYCGSPKDAC